MDLQGKASFLAKITKLEKVYYFRGFDGGIPAAENIPNGQGGSMKKLFYPLTLLLLLFVQVGCESHHKDENIQEEQEYQNNEGTQNDLQKPHIESEHGGNAGNK